MRAGLLFRTAARLQMLGKGTRPICWPSNGMIALRSRLSDDHCKDQGQLTWRSALIIVGMGGWH